MDPVHKTSEINLPNTLFYRFHTSAMFRLATPANGGKIAEKGGQETEDEQGG